LAGTRLQFAYRGTLSYVKGVHVLVEAFSKLPQDRAALDIYGEGEPDYEALLRRLGAGLNVRFRGAYQASDLDKINLNTDIGLVPSICEETLCFAGLEFIHGGVPVIASAIGGMLDYVDASNGVLVQPGDVNELSDAMAMFVRDPSLISAKRPGPNPRYKLASALDGMDALYKSLKATHAKQTRDAATES
jgi:glycosyltransferase involved in cell wall biosynthesis